jgi:hypothetical protein
VSYPSVTSILVLLEWVLAFFFIRGILTGTADNFLLGTILGGEFVLMALVMACYMGASCPSRMVAEDRDEGLLW